MTKPYREYTHGSRWAFWRWKEINPDGRPPVYLWRNHIIHTPWGGLMLHIIRKPDPNRPLHNHPVHFLSVILRGSYIESVYHEGQPTKVIAPHSKIPVWNMGDEHRLRRWVNYKNARKDFHRITQINGVVWTLVFYSRRIHEWGFNVDGKFIQWDKYEAEPHLARPGA